MLLSTAIQTQQDSYAQIQIQIEALQEQQRQIQAYLQKLGSIESKMESAAQLMQEAIADIREACPDELAGYEQLITGFFGGSPVAFLEASVEEVSEGAATDDTPKESDDTITAEVEVIATEEQESGVLSTDATATDSTETDTTTIEATAVETNHVVIKGVEIQPILPVPLQIETMTKYMVCKWLGDLGLEFKRSQAVGDLRARLKAYVISRSAA